MMHGLANVTFMSVVTMGIGKAVHLLWGGKWSHSSACTVSPYGIPNREVYVPGRRVHHLPHYSCWSRWYTRY